MKKLFKTSALALLLGIVFISCKKDKEEPSPVGFFVGLEGLGTDVPIYDFALLIRDNGTVRYYDSPDTTKGASREGTYTMNGNLIDFRIKFTEFTSVYNGTFINDFSRIEAGVWFASEANLGTFNLERR
jgi:hypothetical protein